MANPLYGQNKVDNEMDAVAGKYEKLQATTKTLLASDAGGVFELLHESGVAVTLPAASTCQAGSKYTFICGDATADSTVTRAGSDTVAGAGGATASGGALGIVVSSSVVTFDQSGGLAVGDQAVLICDGVSKWYVSFTAAS